MPPTSDETLPEQLPTHPSGHVYRVSKSDFEQYMYSHAYLDDVLYQQGQRFQWTICRPVDRAPFVQFECTAPSGGMPQPSTQLPAEPVAGSSPQQLPPAVVPGGGPFAIAQV